MSAYDRDRDRWRDYDEEERRFGRGYERGRYEAGRSYGGPYSETARPTYGSRESGGVSTYGERAILVKLGDTDFDIADEDDIRGRTVYDQDGNDIGDVDDLIINQQPRRVRFLQVTSGGFLGLGGTTLLIPVEAITRVSRNAIEIDQRGGRGVGGARYNPALIDRMRERGAYAGYYTGPFSGYGEYSGSATAGRYRGRGPRGYRRSDERIREDVNDRLADYGGLDASDIEVSVSNGEVTLTGTVISRRDKRLAEDLAERVSGVTNVENRLRVSQTGLGTTAGTYGTTAAEGMASGEAATARRGKTTAT